MQTSLNSPLIHSKLIMKFIKDVGMPFNLGPEALGIKASEFMQWISGKEILIGQPHLISLAQYLNLNEDCILDGTYDKDLIRKRLFGTVDALPEKYSQNQFSYSRSSAHIPKYLTLTRGQHFSDMILRKLNISPLLYSNLNNHVSINYFMDLLETLAESGLSEKELDNLAGVLFLAIEDTALGLKFKKAQTYYECYEILSQSSQLFDCNFSYNFDLDRNQVRIESFLEYGKHFHINWSIAKLNRLIRYRHILMGWFPYLSKLPPILPEHKVEYCEGGLKTTYTIKFAEMTSSLLYLSPRSELAEV